MKHILKAIPLVRVFTILFAIIIWATPLALNQIDAAYSSLITPAEVSRTPAVLITGLAAQQTTNNAKLPGHDPESQQIDPSILLLFGIGTIGFFSVSRKKLFLR